MRFITLYKVLKSLVNNVIKQYEFVDILQVQVEAHITWLFLDWFIYELDWPVSSAPDNFLNITADFIYSEAPTLPTPEIKPPYFTLLYTTYGAKPFQPKYCNAPFTYWWFWSRLPANPFFNLICTMTKIIVVRISSMSKSWLWLFTYWWFWSRLLANPFFVVIRGHS